MRDPFEITLDNDRLLAVLKERNKVPQNLTHLTGANLWQTVTEDGVPGLSVILGPMNGGRRGRKPSAISLSTDADQAPQPKGDRLYKGQIALVGDEYKLVKPFKEGVAVRIITTGLLSNRGGTAEDMMRIAQAGQKLRYHGIFPVTADAAEIVGEGIEVTAESRVLFDDRFGKINGLGIPRMRETTIEGVLGGPVLVGQIDGSLKILELTADGWKTHDVTNSPKWQQKFLDLAMTDQQYLVDLEKEKNRKPDKKFRIIKPPSEHPDARD